MLSLGSLGGGVRYAYTSRASGFSAAPYDTLNLSLDVGDDPAIVARNRELVLARVGLPRAIWLKAQHGAAVAEVHESMVGARPEADALVTTAAGLGLASLSADCVLIVLADPITGVIATAHCGRPGLLVGVVARCVAAMHERGAGAIRAAVGPSICGSCYEVPPDMADEVAAAVPAAAARSRAGTPALDIGAGVVAQLADHGVEVVRHVSGCTREDPTLFSYRRDAVTGRLGALIWRAS